MDIWNNNDITFFIGLSPSAIRAWPQAILADNNNYRYRDSRGKRTRSAVVPPNGFESVSRVTRTVFGYGVFGARQTYRRVGGGENENER